MTDTTTTNPEGPPEYALITPAYALIIAGPNLSGALQEQGSFHVHATGCQHLERGDLKRADKTDARFYFRSAEDACWFVYESQLVDALDAAGVDVEDLTSPAYRKVLGGYLQDFHWAPCVPDELPTWDPAGDDSDVPQAVAPEEEALVTEAEGLDALAAEEQLEQARREGRAQAVEEVLGVLTEALRQADDQADERMNEAGARYWEGRARGVSLARSTVKQWAMAEGLS